MEKIVETLSFQAETKQLLDLMIHSLYTNKEIFLRELISNASDALDRLRFEAVLKPELLAEGGKPEILLEPDPAARTLKISDTGIGMTREEVISNVGTIARSGTHNWRQTLESTESLQDASRLIGQFGVGFYSAFMAADRVRFVTRRAGEAAATQWESSGDGTYTITEAEKETRGTSITLYLKEADPENGIEDYTDKWRLTSIIKRHSDFISYPIKLKDIREEVERDETGLPRPDAKDAKPSLVIEEKVLNSMKPIWTRPSSEVDPAEFAEFYQHISRDWDDPMKVLSFRAEGRQEYQALLFIPAKAPHDLYYHAPEYGLRLLSRNVLIAERYEDLLPRYLRFLRGVIDSTDLPLNISRQRLQQDRDITRIRKWLTRKVLETLREMFDHEREQYLKFWNSFGRALKEGVGSDFDNKEKLLPLLLFESSNDPVELTPLAGYVERMKPGQTEIYYLTGESRGILENSPHLEAIKDKGYEVLFLVDPVDELLLQYLPDFDGRKMKSVGKGVINLKDEEDGKGETLRRKQEESSGLLTLVQAALDEHVKQVRLSSRLKTSPACLVVEEHDYSPQMDRLLRRGNGDGPKQRRVLELNPGHPIFDRLLARFQSNPDDPGLRDSADLLFNLALLAEGSQIPEPVRFYRLATQLLENSLSGEGGSNGH